MAPSRFSSLRFTSVGVFPELIRILTRNSSRTVTFSCSAPAFHATGASGIPVHQVPA